MTPALTLEDAQSRILALALIMPAQEIPLASALGRYLSEPIISRRTQPSTDLSTMDGYAIGPERPESGQWQLVGESRAGAPWNGTLKAGQTIRISTGAHVPHGADRILIQENTDTGGTAVTLTSDYPSPLRHIRQRGFDFGKGETLIAAGTRLNAAHIALAASAGHSAVKVRRAPHVAILDSGDELVADPASATDHELPASNGIMLQAMLAPFGCPLTRLGPVGDDRHALAEALTGAEGADILITTGGASVGDHDLMQPALKTWGAAIEFWRVAMKPGKPIMLATRVNADKRKQIIFGLPGNPVSAYVTAFHFALPFIRASMGASDPHNRVITIPAGCALPAAGQRREFLRAYWDGTCVTPVRSQDSSALAALSRANCLIDRPVQSPEITQGEPVPVYLLNT